MLFLTPYNPKLQAALLLLSECCRLSEIVPAALWLGGWQQNRTSETQGSTTSGVTFAGRGIKDGQPCPNVTNNKEFVGIDHLDSL